MSSAFLDKLGTSRLVNNIRNILKNYVPNTRTVNGKPLSEDVQITTTDIAAAPVLHKHDDLYYQKQEVEDSALGTSMAYIDEICQQTKPTDCFTYTLLDDDTYRAYVDYENVDKVTSHLIFPSTYNGKPISTLGGMSYADVLKVASIPYGVTKLSGTFLSCHGLEEVKIPNSVTTITVDAFCYTDSLKSITIPASVTSIESGAFGYHADSLESIEVDPDNTAYKSVGNCLIDKTLDQIMLGCKNSVLDADGMFIITSIGYGAFQSCSGLNTINIRTSSIYDYAFSECPDITEVTLTASTIASCAFESCTSLTTFHILSTNPPILGSNVFNGCSNLSQIIVPTGCAEAYKAATNWSAYADIIVEEGTV